MACNVILCFVTLLKLQRTKLRYRPQKARGGQAERAGVRMEARTCPPFTFTASIVKPIAGAPRELTWPILWMINSPRILI
jgi:hypothetical protein